MYFYPIHEMARKLLIERIPNMDSEPMSQYQCAIRKA